MNLVLVCRLFLKLLEAQLHIELEEINIINIEKLQNTTAEHIITLQ